MAKRDAKTGDIAVGRDAGAYSSEIMNKVREAKDETPTKTKKGTDMPPSMQDAVGGTKGKND